MTIFVEIKCDKGCAHFINVKTIALVDEGPKSEAIVFRMDGTSFTVEGMNYAQFTAEIIRQAGTPTPRTRFN